jgi:hypothetical protein
VNSDRPQAGQELVDPDLEDAQSDGDGGPDRGEPDPIDRRVAVGQDDGQPSGVEEDPDGRHLEPGRVAVGPCIGTLPDDRDPLGGGVELEAGDLLRVEDRRDRVVVDAHGVVQELLLDLGRGTHA